MMTYRQDQLSDAMISDCKFITVKAASYCTLQALKSVDILQLLGHCMLMKTGSLLHDTYKPAQACVNKLRAVCVCVMYMCAVQDQHPSAGNSMKQSCQGI